MNIPKSHKRSHEADCCSSERRIAREQRLISIGQKGKKGIYFDKYDKVPLDLLSRRIMTTAQSIRQLSISIPLERNSSKNEMWKTAGLDLAPSPKKEKYFIGASRARGYKLAR